jgi:hypothetical protein
MVTSTAGYVGDTNIPVYSASKHGVGRIFLAIFDVDIMNTFLS